MDINSLLDETYNKTHELNKELVYEIASDIYWKYVAKRKLSQVQAELNEGKVPKDMLSIDIFFEKMDGLIPNFKEADAEHVTELYDSVQFEILKHHKYEQNLLGRFYFDELVKGIPPNFSRKEFLSAIIKDSDQHAPYKIKVTGRIPKVGSLALRTPLPAVVLADRDIDSLIIEVGSTRNALGFDKKLFLQVVSKAAAPNSKIILSGYFIILTSPEKAASWENIIPNSMRIFEKHQISYKDSTQVDTLEVVQKKERFFKKLFKTFKRGDVLVE